MRSFGGELVRGGVCGGRFARRRGLTLLEVILAIALMILLLGCVYTFYDATLRTREAGSTYARDIMVARAVLARMADEIQHATDLVPGDGIGFRGEKESITIVRARLPELYCYQEFDPLFDELPPAQMDLIRIRYDLAWDNEGLVDEEGIVLCHGMSRFEQKTFDPNPRFVISQDSEGLGDEGWEEEEELDVPKAEGGLYAPEIKYLRFRYFDGAVWRDQWQIMEEDTGLDMGSAAASGKGTYALPQAIEITIGKERGTPPPEYSEFGMQEEDEEQEEEEYHPDRFTVVVYLPQADSSRMASMSYGRQANPETDEDAYY